MNPTTVATFLGVCLLAYVVPGPDWLLVAKSSLRSRSAGVVAALGVQTGLIGHGALALVGLSALIASQPDALTVIQVLGAIYLMYLGIRGIANAGEAEALTMQEETSASRLAIFRECAVSNLLNPKAILFFVAVLPQFLDKSGNIPSQIIVLTILDVALGIVWWLSLVFLVRKILEKFRSQRTVRTLHIVSSGALLVIGVGLGVYEAVKIVG